MDGRAKTMAVLLALHRAGFQHNGLDEDTRHILFDESRERAFLVDFENVERHICTNTGQVGPCRLNMPLKEYSGPPAPHILGCEEIWQLGCSVHFFGNGPRMFLRSVCFTILISLCSGWSRSGPRSPEGESKGD